MTEATETAAQERIRHEVLDRTALKQVAKLHQQALPNAFLSSLGVEMLIAFYDGVQKYPGGQLLSVRVEDSQVIAVITGVDDVEAFHRWLIRKHLPWRSFKLLPGLLKQCFSARVRRKLKELLFYPRRAKQAHSDLPRAELLSLAVDASARRKGLAKRLYTRLVKNFQEQRVPAFRILVGGELTGARAFYESQGAIAATRFPLHAGGETVVYIHTVFGTFTQAAQFK